ncbi:MAG: sigma 54-interacting transcriptional regulator [Desulfobacterales bacterium]|nr:sigma 54-interacting transcriptional regulator [Desulfobacterales bacterium]
MSFAIGYLHFIIFLRRRELLVDLFFSLMAFAIALSSFFEIWAFKTGSLPDHITIHKANLCAQILLWINFAWFVFYYTKSSKRWPPILISILYGLAVIINLFSPTGVLFHGNFELTPYSLLSGELFYLLKGDANPFRIIGDAAWLLILIYTAASTVRFGRTGNAKTATLFGTTIFLCLGLGYLHGTLIDLGVANPPYLGSFLFLPLTLVMSFSLAGDVLLASRLAHKIKKAEERWRNLLMNVHLVVLGIKHDKTIFFVNPFFLQLTGYEEDEVLNRPFAEILPEEERREITLRLEMVITGQATINAERSLSVVTQAGERRTILWSSVLLEDTGYAAPGILSIGKDITDQKKAESSRDQAIDELEALKEKLVRENISLKQMIQANHGFTEIIGKSDGLLYVLQRIQQVAQTEATVLIMGETGTGKELVAQAIHRESDRSDNPFIRVNCAAIPAELVESELFGHEPGAFTNAVTLRRGKFELAEGGTILLDEISEMPLDIQAKLLSVLQEKEFERVGGSQTIQANVRIISATNRDLENEITEGRFRADLFYRLNVYPITIPPLRARTGDIPLLINHFISVFNKKFGKNVDDISPFILDSLTGYDWPGNVRELRNMLERAVITSTSSNLQLPDDMLALQKNNHSEADSLQDILPLAEIERQHILRALTKTNWQISGKHGAANILKMNPSTLRSRIKKLKLK